MNVKSAIGLMARNPAVDFPWQPALINLINGFVPADRQLDPLTAEAKEVQEAIGSMDASLQEMVYNSNLDSVNVIDPVPAPVAVIKNSRSNLLLLFAFTLCACALMMVWKVGDGATGADVVEILKLILSVVTDQPAT
jgi:hypothetical protein